MSNRFPSCNEPIGLYPIVDSAEWLKQLLPLGVKTIQLRLKNQSNKAAEACVATSVEIAHSYGAHIFINDYWELAIKHKAYGVHLGQEDLQHACKETLAAANLRLGISTHSFDEIEQALKWKPSYIAFGPIYHTETKTMPFQPQGLDRLQYWVKQLDYPMVAIGGINLERFPKVLATGVNGIALISAITKAADPIGATREFLKFENFASWNKT
jgi:thiamine-phosphate diphosphorylase